MSVPAKPGITRMMKWLTLTALIAGAILRLWIYLQNRNLILDEANIARNIYERGFLQLLHPLSYEQFAPPVYLWATKLCTLLFGMSEQALRLYPFLCGLGALVVFYKIIRTILPAAATWYPASLFAFAAIFIRYSSEVKQYMPDVFISLLLVWLAMCTELTRESRTRFLILWILAGSLAIWSSMPSVFILAGVGGYYGWQAVKNRHFKNLWPVVFVSAVWAAQFLVYYFTALRAQANSEYLQSFHQYDFLFATPSKPAEWQHNWKVFSALMEEFEGKYPYVHSINIAFLIAGAVMLLRRSAALFMLLAVPVLALCVAACFDQYSLKPRVSLFIIPMLILLVGYGFAQYYYLRSVWLKGLLVAAGLYAAGCNIYQTVQHVFRYEEITEGMQYLQQKNIPGKATTIFHSSVPAFIYYTEMHPGKEQWATLKDADRMQWYHNYDSLGWHMQHIWKTKKPLGFLYTNFTERIVTKYDSCIDNHLVKIDSLGKPYIRCYLYMRDTAAVE